MTRSLFFTLIITLIMLCLVWLAPWFSADTFDWLTPGWQWIITLLVLLPVSGLLIRKWLKKFHSKYRVNKAAEREEFLQSKRQLTDDWRLLWKLLNKRNIDSPYALPWLMILGTDGSGKTGWLIDAGFEKITTWGTRQQSGVIFWLGDHAVIVELAGHYYARDKEQLDEYLWQHLINLLKKKRPRRPLTGIIAALSTDQLVMRQPSGLLELARQLHWRLLEMNRQFGMQLPAWFLLTQADRLNGFTELFRRRSSQRQVQPWGFSLQEGYRRDHFRHAFDLCQQELANSLLDCIHHEKEGNARQAQMRYVLQFALLGERLRFFCEEIFRSQHGIPSPVLKGIWFSSCAQYGNSINLLAAELARQHGFKVMLEQPQIPDNQSYFNQQFFNRILFNDLDSVGENPAARKLWQLKATLTIASMVIILAAGLNVFWSQIQYNNQLLNQQKEITREYRQSMKILGKKYYPVDVIPPLSRLQSLNQLYQQSSDWQYHGALLDWQTAETVKTAYHQQLNQKLINPIAQQLHSRLQLSEARHSQSLFDDLQYYLMLFKPELRDTGQLENHIQRILLQQRDLSRTDQKALTLLLQDAWTLDALNIQPDQELIRQSSQILASQINERLIYDHIKAMPEYRGSISMQDLFGNEFASLFTVNTKEGNADFLRLYTHNAYKELDLSPTSPLLKQELANLNRIEKNSSHVSIIELARLSRRIKELYFHDYIQAWHGLVNRIELRPASSLAQLNQQITQLNSGNNALLSSFVNTIISETSLADDSPSTDPLALTRDANQIVQSTKIQKTTRITRQSRALLTNKTITADDPAIVNQAFEEYTEYSAKLQAQLTPVLAAVQKELHVIAQHYNQQQALYDLSVGVINDDKSALNDLWRLAASDTTQSRQWLNLIANQIWKQAMTGAGHHCQNLWQQNIYSFWLQHLQSRFPFSAKARDEVQLNELTELFKPKGLVDEFSQTTLVPFLKKTQSGWHLKNVKGLKLPVSPAFLRQLSLIRQLQQQFFGSDGNLHIGYQMRCIELTPDVTELSLRDSNGRFIYRHGPQLWQERKWPGTETEQLTVSMSDNGTRLFQKSYDGIWAWIRFVFDNQQRQSGNKVELDYENKGYKTRLELTLDRRGNPFDPELFAKIKLPEKILP